MQNKTKTEEIIMKKITILPKTRIGKISFWIAIGAFISTYLNYWLAMIFGSQRVFAVPGMLTVGAMITCGITSIIAITKYRDRAILLFVSAILGVLGIMFVLGEFLAPH